MTGKEGTEQKDGRRMLRRAAAVLLFILVVAAMVTGYFSGTETTEPQSQPSASGTEALVVEEQGSYDSRDQVALYLHKFGKLPENYITKAKARSLGWQGGGLDPYAKGKCIGGDRFGNREGRLPEKNQIRYYECDIDTMGKDSRGTKRIIYSDRGDIYYTADHYRTFSKLYDREGAL